MGQGDGLMDNIIRVKDRDNHFHSIIDNRVFTDRQLSIEAKGLLCTLLSMKDHFQIQIPHMCEAISVGKDKMYRLLSELKTTGYLAFIEKRDVSEGEAKGRFISRRYMVFEHPSLNPYVTA